MPFLRAVGSEYLHEASPPACLSFAARIKGRETVVKAEGRVAEMSPVSKDTMFFNVYRPLDINFTEVS